MTRPKYLLYGTTLVLFLAAGVAHGVLTDRWSSPRSDVSLDDVPFSIGGWDGTSAPKDAEQLPALGEGNDLILRRYTDRSSGASVLVFLTRGRAGPMAAAHSPMSCYPGAGFRCPSGPSVRGIESDGSRHAFRVATFSKTERASPVHARVFWSYSAAGVWEVPESPRLRFAGRKQLYKLYVIRPLARPDEPSEDDPAVPFIEHLVAEIARTCFGS
jgi:Protein of unknown function (DUF3485)